MERLSDDVLLGLLNDAESDRAERKAAWKGDVASKARQAVCAFANDLPGHNAPGVLFIGAQDSGEPSHLEIGEGLLLALSDMRTDGNIVPLPVLTVEKRWLKGAEMAIVTVYPSDSPPVKFDGRIWIRTGPRRAVANAQEERILNEKRRYKNLPFDLYPVPSARLDDLSRVLFESEYLPKAVAEDVLAENGRCYEERLASCRMVVSPEVTTPTVMGLISVGRSPRDHVPGAYVQFVRIDGDDLADPVDDEEAIGGDLGALLRQLEVKLRAHNRIAVDIVSEPTHRVTLPYPPAALQQIVYNAVLHRTYENTHAPIRVYWYNDRVEVHSPGGPYGNVTTENFGRPGVTDYRNPNLADAMKTLGFVQTFGRGIATARRELERNGNPPLHFDLSQSSVICTLRRSQ
jgi:ATP-dependent DNA helicase RecG